MDKAILRFPYLKFKFDTDLYNIGSVPILDDYKICHTIPNGSYCSLYNDFK